jgi:hypothetical protein
MNTDQKMAALIAVARLAQQIAEDNIPGIISASRALVDLGLADLPADPPNLTDDAAARDKALIDAAEEAKLGLGG